MARDKDFHHGAIIEAATAEFLEYGFKDASMRRIAAAVGMSVAGLYRHFSSKEDMFSALVDPTYRGLTSLFGSKADELARSVGAGESGFFDSDGDARLAMTYIYDHFDAFRLIVCRSQGTKYETFLHDLAVMEEGVTLSFMDMLKKQGVPINDFRLPELHLLTTANVNAIFQAVEHGFTREEAMHYADTLDRFFTAAWKEFFGY